jgi:hypothetical protein
MIGSKIDVVFFLLALGWISSACMAGSPSTPQLPVPSLAASPPAILTSTVQCEQKLVVPEITEIQPTTVIPGIEIKVIGKGGFIQDTCGGYNESARSFKLYLDQKPILDLSCYVNHCEGKAILDQNIPAGMHCLSVQQDGCEFKLKIEPK